MTCSRKSRLPTVAPRGRASRQAAQAVDQISGPIDQDGGQPMQRGSGETAARWRLALDLTHDLPIISDWSTS